MNYQWALDRMAAGKTKLQNNTYLERVRVDVEDIPKFGLGPAYAVCLHNTYVVIIYRNGLYQINDGGWKTATTKERINAYSPANLGQENFEWFLFPRLWTTGPALDEPIPFESGMYIDGDGIPVDLEALEKANV